MRCGEGACHKKDSWILHPYKFSLYLSLNKGGTTNEYDNPRALFLLWVSPYVRPWFAEGWESNLDRTKITQKAHLDFFLLFLFSPHDQSSKESPFFSWFCSLECLCFYIQNEVRCNLAAIVYHFIATINFLFIYLLHLSTHAFILSLALQNLKKFSENFAIDNKKIILIKIYIMVIN